MLGKMVIHSVNASFQQYGLWLNMYIVYCTWYNSEHCENEGRMNYGSFSVVVAGQETRNFLAMICTYVSVCMGDSLAIYTAGF